MIHRQHRQSSIFRELGRDWNTLKSLQGKQKLQFLWDYYRWRILACIGTVIAVCSFISILWEGQKPCRLRVCVVLNTADDCSPWFSSFAEELRSDGKPGAVDVNLDQPFDYDNVYYYVHEIEVMTTVSSGRMDAAVCGEDMYRYLLSINACLPLDLNLPEELYTALYDSGKITYDTAGLAADDHGQVDPTEGIGGYYAVDLNGTCFGNLYNQTETVESLYAVIISNTEHLEECEYLIRALTEE